MEPVKPEQTAGPVESPAPSKESETVLLEPTKNETVAQDETKPAEAKPIVLELGKSDGAKDEKPASADVAEPVSTDSGKIVEPETKSSEKEEKTTSTATEPAADAKAPETTPAQKTTPPPPAVQDEDSDDELDDLDDMLDEFDAAPPNPESAPAPAVEPIDEDWAAQLQAGMADLLNDMNETPEMKEQFDVLAKELNEAMAASSSKTGEKKPSVTEAASSANFQEKIKQAMERMQSSEAEVGQAMADTEGEDFLAEMMKQLGGGEGGAGEEDFSGMLVNMMEQLTSREVLYEPMKELSEKYPAWIEKNEAKTPKAEMDKYKGQFEIVKQIVTKFEEPGYKDENEAQRQYIIECMQKMQDAGAPPTELMGDMQQDIEAPDMDPNCGVQ